MNSGAPRELLPLDVDLRELAIIRLLREQEGDDGMSVKEIYEAIKEKGDHVTIQAYYKILDALHRAGKVETTRDGEADLKRYRASPYLTSDTALGIDEIYEILDSLAPTEAIAKLIDARGYFEEKQETTLTSAAQALLEEDPVDLVFRMLVHKYRLLEADLEMYLHRAVEGDQAGNHELRDRTLENRMSLRQRELEDLAYMSLGLSKASLTLSPFEKIKRGQIQLMLDEQELRRELGYRVFGEKAIYAVNIGAALSEADRAAMVVSGSDGSTHSSSMQLMSAVKFIDDTGGYVVTFNNSVARVRLSDRQHNQRQGRAQLPFPYYSVPISRSAIDSPSNRGMVLAPFMFKNLQEGQYEHMAKCATDVVQWRADEAVFGGTARSWGSGEMLPKPRVHFRDGTITPQDREYKHYNKQNEYGDMVREGIGISRKVLQNFIGAANPRVFAGATKTTQKRFFSTLLNWYIVEGCKQRLGRPIDPNWDQTRAANIPDNEAMSFLLTTFSSRKGGPYYVTFAVARPFHSLTEFYSSSQHAGFNWVQFFERRRDRDMQEYETGLTDELPYLGQVSDIADDNFVFMCQHADYVNFYVGHTYGKPPPILPRYEFLATLRDISDANERRAHVNQSVKLLVEGLDLVQFSQDKEHNFLSKKILTKIIPSVIFDAHEKCKALGRKLEAELRSEVIWRLQQIKKFKIKPSDIVFRPVNVIEYVRDRAKYWRRDTGNDDEGGSGNGGSV